MIRYIGLIIVIFLLSCDKRNKEIPQETKKDIPQWESIFNGKNLNGWIPKIVGQPLGENFGKTFSVKDRILSIRYDAYGDKFDSRFGGLYFNRKLKNYRLKVEYRFVGETAPGAPEWGYRDSGVQYHSQSPQSLKIDQPFPICLEYNFHGGNGTDERPVGAICANGTFIEINGKKNESYCTDPIVKETFHGDQWVTMELDIKDGKITHFVNGKEILSFNNPSLNPENEIAKTLIQNGNMALTEGYISFQSNSHPIDFRKIELVEY
jgi:hypothetical protein